MYIICDDNIGFAKQLKARILDKAPGSAAETAENITELTQLMKKHGKKVEAVFMDISLNDGNGITAASELKKLYPDLRIVYITGYEVFSQSVFECAVGAEPIAFLKKPIEERYLDNALSKLKSTPVKDENYVEIKHGGSVTYIPQSEIIAAYSYKRKIIVHTANSDIEFYGKLSDFVGKLQEEFAQCHKSYIVNTSYLRKIDNWSTIHMSDGFSCPISRKYTNDFKIKVIEKRGAVQ